MFNFGIFWKFLITMRKKILRKARKLNLFKVCYHLFRALKNEERHSWADMNNSIVDTRLGKVRGCLTTLKNGKKIVSFKKIPYAEPPIGNLRFKNPQPVKPWKDTLDLSRNSEAPMSVQVPVLRLIDKQVNSYKMKISPDSKFVIGQEDCLYLNVFTPQDFLKSNLLEENLTPDLPVIIWIHGGAFCVGNNDGHIYGPEIMLKRDLVLVTINYRLGPLGFFTLGPAKGNQGMHDQVLAMKWVQTNIEVFGGNPKNVTLMGESAGAMSSLLHLTSPLSQGLFHKIIAFSGSPSTPFLHNDRKSVCYGRAFAKKVLENQLKEHTSVNDEELLDMLKDVPSQIIGEHMTLFKDWDTTNPVPWKPTLDPDAGSDAFMPRSFENAIIGGYFDKSVKVISGVNSEEGLIISAQFHKSPLRWNFFWNEWERWAPMILFNREANLVTEQDREKVMKAREEFFSVQNDTIPKISDENLRSLEQLITTAIFHAPWKKDMKLLASHGIEVYCFEFAYQGTMTLADIFRLPPIKMFMNFTGRHLGKNWFQSPNLGVCHGDEMFYYFPFGASGFPPTLKSSNDKLVCESVSGFIFQFAQDGFKQGYMYIRLPIMASL